MIRNDREIREDIENLVNAKGLLISLLDECLNRVLEDLDVGEHGGSLGSLNLLCSLDTIKARIKRWGLWSRSIMMFGNLGRNVLSRCRCMNGSRFVARCGGSAGRRTIVAIISGNGPKGIRDGSAERRSRESGRGSVYAMTVRSRARSGTMGPCWRLWRRPRVVRGVAEVIATSRWLR